MTTNAKGPASVVVENLSLSFGTTQVLKGVNLTIEPGEFFAFLGPSGSGKSTLLRAIAGFGPEPGGRILIDGQSVADLPPWKRNVGMVFQSYALWPHMTVAKNVAFGLEERKVAKAEIKQRVSAALDLVGLADYAERRPTQLSGGQQQRVALARTIVVEPRVLLLDEPLSNLDANLRVQMRQDILELQRKLQLTTIFVTHDQEEANTTSNRIAVLDQGVVQQVGAPIELYDKPANAFVAKFLGTANIMEGGIETVAGAPVFTTKGGLKMALAGDNKGAGMIVFRPQDVTLSPGDSTADGAGAGGFIGIVKSSEFLGNITRYDIDAGGETLLVDQTHHAGASTLQPGQSVTLIVQPERVKFIA